LPDAGEDVVVGVDQEILFDASGSRDPDGAIVDYTWDFGDGTTASGIYVRHRFRESGRFAVSLTVTDNTDVHNNTASDSRMVTVNHAPTPVIDAQASACAGEEVAFSGLKSSDPDGQITRFEWRFGKGTTVENAEAKNVFRTPGTYDLDLVVDDGRGLNNSRAKATQALHVNRPPQPEAGPDRLVCPGEQVTFDGSTSIDWDGEISSYDWTFGDGGTAEGVTVTHLFEKPGLYETRLAVTDDSGSVCATAHDVAWTRVDAPPVAAAGADREGFAGGAHDQILFDASGSSDADGELLSYLWDFGDGVTLSGEKVLHAFAEPGVYAVRLTASDGSGLTCGQATDELTVTIHERELKAATLAEPAE
jgi:large repetitive protein